MIAAEGHFFVAGGTVPPGSPSYVERSADRELYEALLASEYCYVLNSRQMGKSSLAVRTVERLQRAGVRTAFVDLTKIGSSSVTEEQWFIGFLSELGRGLGLRKEVALFVKDNVSLPPGQRLMTFMQDVVARLGRPVVVMVDEVDAVRSLSFSTDGFFAGLRQLHNGRASDPELRSLTLCLLGAALPMDLIRDPRVTPFNVGKRIELRDFTPDEAAPFANVLGPGGSTKLPRVLHWTGGHPFLTQVLCAGLAGGHNLEVDSLVRSRYLDARVRDTDTNLADVGNRLLGRGDPGVGDEERANVLSLYGSMLKTGIADDEANPAAARIKMSGVARLQNGRLTIRNRIYQEVFGKDWIQENMPGQELRRQRKAFWKGVLRTGALAGTAVAVIGALAIKATRAEHLAADHERDANRRLYEARIFAAGERLENGRIPEVKRLLDVTRTSPDRNLEWGIVAGMVPPLHPISAMFAHDVLYSPNSRTLWVNDTYRIRQFDAQTLAEEPSLVLPKGHPGINGIALAPDGSFIAAPGQDGTLIVWKRGESSPVVLEGALHRPASGVTAQLLSAVVSPDGKCLCVGTANSKGHREAVLVFRTSDWRQAGEIPIPGNVQSLKISPDGRMLIAGDYPATEPRGGGVDVIDVRTWKIRKRLTNQTEGILRVAWSPDGKSFASASTDGTTELWDAATLRPARTFQGYVASVHSLIEFHPESGVTFGRAVKVRRGSESPNAAVDFSPDGKRLYTAGFDGNLSTWDVTSGELLSCRRVMDGDAWDLSASSDGRNIAVASSNYGVTVLDTVQSNPALELKGFKTFFSRAAFSPNGQLIACGDWQGNLRIWKVGEPEPLYALKASDRVISLGWKNDNVIALVVGASGRETVDLRTRRFTREKSLSRPLVSWPNPQAVVQNTFFTAGRLERLGARSLAVRDQGLWATEVSSRGQIATARNGETLIRRADTFEVIRRFAIAAPLYMAWSPDGRTLMTSDGAVVKLVDVDTGNVQDFIGHEDILYGGCFSQDGKRIVTASEDQTVRVWSRQTGEPLLTLEFPGTVYSADLSPDEKWLAVLAGDLKLRLFHIADPRSRL